MKQKILIASAWCFFSLAAMAQNPNTDPYPGYDGTIRPDWSLMQTPAQRGKTNVRTRIFSNIDAPLPDHWNTGAQPYFPPIFGQIFGSCGVASHIGYVLTSEMNSYRNTNAKLLENQLAPNFEYPFTYHGPGKEAMAVQVGFPNAKLYGGRTYSSIYGVYDTNTANSNEFSWVQGYEIFYNAMCNRLTNTVNFPVNVGTEEGRQAVKRFLFNHNGDPRFGGRGGVVGIGAGMGGVGLDKIPSTPENNRLGVAGMQYMKGWAASVNHALCIVGYDDRIEFDLDANGVYGEKDNQFHQDETGAWIIANTWGGWANKGFVYVPYANAGPMSKTVHNSEGKECYHPTGFWQPVIYNFRCGYKPKRTIKAVIDYVGRSEISVKVGIAQDTLAKEPEKIYQFAYINYTGDSRKQEQRTTPDQTPMLGRWADGQMHYEPMEFGVDVTDLSESFDLHKPLKYFLIVDAKQGAKGKGYIHSAEVIDYEFNPKGNGVPFILKRPKRIYHSSSRERRNMIETVMPGQELPSPFNLTLTDKQLSWEAVKAPFQLAGYAIFKDGKRIATTTNTHYTLSDTQGIFTVAAIYTIADVEHLSAMSNNAASRPSLEQAFTSHSIKFEDGGISIPNVATSEHPQFTLEYWLKPSQLFNWNQVVANRWGQFMIHSDKSGAFVAGWNTNGERIETRGGMLRNGEWCHLAVVVDGNNLKVYVNGHQEGELTSSRYSGFPAIGSLNMGNAGNQRLYGELGEVKVWDCARTGQQIKAGMKTPIALPTQMPHLLAYLKMDTFEKDGVTYVRDHAHGNHAPFIMPDNWKKADIAQGQLLDKAAMQSLDGVIECSQEIFVGCPTLITLFPSINAYNVKWSVAGKSVASTNVLTPTFIFDKVGSNTVEATITDITGKYQIKKQAIVEVKALPQVTADFVLSAPTVSGADRMSFRALNQSPGCTYLWSMPGADVEEAQTSIASASYSSIGEKTVTLTVTAPDGATYSSTQTFQVVDAIPVPKFSISPSIVVKGEPVQLKNESAYGATTVTWRFSSYGADIVSTTKDATITPTVPGVYDLTFIAGNSMGFVPLQQSRALIVCNANSENGLIVNGEAKNVITKLPKMENNELTLEYWLKPFVLENHSNGIYLGTGAHRIEMSTNAQGDLTLVKDGNKVTCPQLYHKDEWHHYAINITSNGNVLFYCDGVLQSASGSLGALSIPAIATQLQLGAAKEGEANSHVHYDELRVWNRSVGIVELQQLSVAPIKDVSGERSRNLKLYYNFNQTSGNVKDQVSGKVLGIRSNNFGPDGDSWTDSKGVFALCFEHKPFENPEVKSRRLDLNTYRLVDVSDEELKGENRPADYAFDNNESTYWHSKWQGGESGYAHIFTLMRSNRDKIVGLNLSCPHPARYQPSQLTIEQSNDAEIWDIVDYQRDIEQANNWGILFTRPLTARYIRVKFTKGVNGSNFMRLNELKLYGEPEAEELNVEHATHVTTSTAVPGADGPKCLDDNENTQWQTQSNAYPHSITVMLEKGHQFNAIGIDFAPGTIASRMNLFTSRDSQSWKAHENGIRIPLYQSVTFPLTETVEQQFVRLDFILNSKFNLKGKLGIRELHFYTGEEMATGIDAVNVDSESASAVFDLNGHHVADSLEDLAPGVYIYKGVKIMID